MTQILVAGAVALVVAIGLTPVLIRVFSRQGFGQEIRVEGPESHQTKRGTPSMGGVAIIVALVAGYFAAHLVAYLLGATSDREGGPGPGPTASGLLVLGLAVMLAIVGFLDDIIKVRKHRNLGLNKTAKSVGQAIAAIIFAVLVLQFRNEYGYTPASKNLSYARDINAISLGGLGIVVFVLFVWLVVASWSNAVNFTDGLDGLAAGSMAMVMGAYVLITYWQYQNACEGGAAGVARAPGCYPVRDPLDLAILATAGGAACLGFLWWNAAPAKIFMGDTGSLALGGLLAGISIVSHTEMIAVVLGALFVAEAVSVVLQILVFRTSGRRLFRMAPFHHHFELGGWAETTVIIRFWLLTAISVGLGLSLFYSEFKNFGG
ncbi:phospho-N-acetylmuramoyl-pentapeptide-transferase [Gordonia araii]|uniref:phospho-N-acetylmuramoyl-pentapeptide- transferase n=1 Tax=Gordonia araii TaxID=263909 RepID=UPI00058D53E4|nr:phospho-N-acetylmuramoyl-pentapeptide-transferase [Gordonia araii]NNG98506.1 phospho-N-acetylmuramoyl-pentapeptide-transferase [Gordonia araii NBRC 100433]